MIVVAIIGILAAIAIPNFLRFQAKSKQSEAKTNLGGVFTAETAYFGEKNVFGDLNVVSWAPIGTSRYKYMVGIVANSMGLISLTFDAWSWPRGSTWGLRPGSLRARRGTSIRMRFWTSGR